MRSVPHRDRIDTEAPAVREPNHRSRDMTPGQAAANLGVTPSLIERLLELNGVRVRRQHASDKRLAATVTPEMFEYLKNKLKGIRR